MHKAPSFPAVIQTHLTLCSTISNSTRQMQLPCIRRSMRRSATSPTTSSCRRSSRLQTLKNQRQNRSLELPRVSCIPQNRSDVTVHSRLFDRILIAHAIASLLCERIDFHQHLDFWRPSCFSSHVPTSRLSMRTEVWWEPSGTQAAQPSP